MPIGKESIQRVAKAASQSESGGGKAQDKTENKAQTQVKPANLQPQKRPVSGAQTTGQARKSAPAVKTQSAIKAEKSQNLATQRASVREQDARGSKPASGRYEPPVPITGDLPTYLL